MSSFWMASTRRRRKPKFRMQSIHEFAKALDIFTTPFHKRLLDLPQSKRVVICHGGRRMGQRHFEHLLEAMERGEPKIGE